MNGAHWHLTVNHLPIIFPVVGVIVMITGLVFKSEAVKRTAFMIFILGTFTAVVAVSTGEEVEAVVKKISGITKDYIERHEEAAETFALLAYVLGIISLIGLWANFKQKVFSNIFAIGTTVFTFIVLFFATHTGTTGGEIRHIEIRNGNDTPAIENSDSY